MAYKVFTNGSVLQASEVNDNLMRQAVITFSNAAARTAAIPSPSEGMLTYLEDSDTYFTWNGSSWVIESSGLVLLNNTTFSGSNLIRINSVFSSQYDRYLINLQITSTSANSVGLFRYLTAVNTPTTTSSYFFRGFFSSSSSLGNYQGDTTPNILISDQVTGSAGCSSQVWISNPFLATRTNFRAEIMNQTTPGATLYSLSSVENSTSSFNGFEFAPNTGTITGTVKTYGYRNA